MTSDLAVPAYSKQVLDALRWIIGLLTADGTPYHITGGFAARLYGAKRPLADIDIDIPAPALQRLLPALAPYLTFGPARHKDSTWNIFLATLEFKGQAIDLTTPDEARVMDKTTGQWVPLVMHFESAETVPFDGMLLKVQNRVHLIDYKSRIGFEEEKHLSDIQAVRLAGRADRTLGACQAP